jgi:site-specific DNA-cytosine methylase
LSADGFCSVSWHVLDTRKHGALPQSRRRIYIIGLAAHLVIGTPTFGVAPSAVQLSAVLDEPELGEGCDVLPPMTQSKVRANVTAELGRLRALGIDPAEQDRIIDADASVGRHPRSSTHSPCLTHSRGGGL